MATTTHQSSNHPTSAPAPIRVLVVDDHPAVRRGVQALIDSEPDMRVLAEARCAEEALAKLTNPVDVAIVDYHLGDGRDGLSLTADLKASAHGPRVLIYSAFADVALAVSALIAGADGLVDKHELGAGLAGATRAVARGQDWLPAIAAPIAQAMRARLEPQDQAIFGMLVDGIDPEVIAERLGITEQELHRRRVVMLRALTPRKTPTAGPSGARAPLDYDRARRRRDRRVA